MKITIKKTIFLILGLVMLLPTACSQQDLPDTPEDEQQLCSISISVEGNSLIASRTSLVDPDDNLRGKQHVTRVHLYIYKADGNDYICVAEENVNWNHLAGAMQGLETRLKSYTTKFQSYEDGVNYLFLAMGFDDTYTGDESNPVYSGTNSVATYGQPDKIATVGKKLSEESFALQSGKSTADIAASELFAGCRVFTKTQLKNSEAANQPVELYRRVAGVVGYFKNLPETYAGETVDHVSLCLYTHQNTKTCFIPRLPASYSSAVDVPDEEYVDYITSPYTAEDTDGRILSSIAVKDIEDGKFCLSSFILPVAASIAEGQSTLALVLYAADGTEIARRRVLYSVANQDISRSGTGIIDPDRVDDTRYMHYPLRANHFYRMGSKDTPVDLSGQTGYIYLELDPVWGEYYGGSLDYPEIPGIGIDKEWGEHNGGKLD